MHSSVLKQFKIAVNVAVEFRKSHFIAVSLLLNVDCLNVQADPSIKEAVQPNGLVRGHAYSVTALQKVQQFAIVHLTPNALSLLIALTFTHLMNFSLENI